MIPVQLQHYHLPCPLPLPVLILAIFSHIRRGHIRPDLRLHGFAILCRELCPVKLGAVPRILQVLSLSTLSSIIYPWLRFYTFYFTFHDVFAPLCLIALSIYVSLKFTGNVFIELAFTWAKL